MTNFRDSLSYRYWNISNYKLVLENCSYQYCILSDVNMTHCSLYQNSMVISSVLDYESVWTLMVDILNSDCFADCSLDLTLIVSFRKIAFLVCRWKQIIIISRSWNWTHLKFSTQCSNGCRQCVLCNFQWSLFSVMSATVLYIGGALFSGHNVYFT